MERRFPSIFLFSLKYLPKPFSFCRGAPVGTPSWGDTWVPPYNNYLIGRQLVSHPQSRNPVPVEQVEGDEAGQEEPGQTQGQPVPGRHLHL